MPKRKKGCEFCRTDKDFHCSVIHFDNGENDTVDVQMPFKCIEIIYKTGKETVFHLDIDVKFCPMCGRKLVKEKKNNDRKRSN